MSVPVPLVVSRTPVPRISVGPTRATDPYLAVVYATAGGEVVCFDGRPMTPSQQVLSRFRFRYEIDMRDHDRTVLLGSTPLVSRDGVHAFQVTVSFSFRVDGWTGAETWVRGGRPDALPVVYGHIGALFHEAGRAFDIENSAGLQQHLQTLCRNAMPLPQGLLIHGCRATVALDAATADFVRGLVEAQRTTRTAEARHLNAKGDAAAAIELEAMKQAAAIDSARRQAAAQADLLITTEGLIRQYLVTHPEDVAGAIEMFRQLDEARTSRADLQDDRALALFKLMADKGLMLPGELNPMREQLLGRVQQATGAAPATAPRPAVAWDAPLAIAPAPVAAPPVHPAEAAGERQPPEDSVPAAEVYEPTLVMPAPPADAAAFPGAALIYLVLDESLDTGCLEEVNRGLRQLHEALADAPAVSEHLRLCVLGMASSTDVRLSLDQVSAGTRTPILARRPGLSYEQAFRTLRALLPQDVAMVKGQGTRVLRPLVLFLSGGVPDGADWQEAHAQLVHRSTHASAPEIIACGFGAAQPTAIQRIATRPEFGHMGPSAPDTAAAAHNIAVFLRDCVVGYGRRLASGSTEFSLVGPDGFRPASDSL